MNLRRVFILAVIPVIFLSGIWWAMFSEKPIGSEILKSRQSLQRIVTYRDKFYGASVVNEQAWIVGYYGSILHVKGSPPLWERQNSSTTSPLFGVSFADENNGLVVGEKGLVLRTTNGGQTWEEVRKKGVHKLYIIYRSKKEGGEALWEELRVKQGL